MTGSARPVGRVLVGTAGWADADLIASGWYPPGTSTPAGRLRHYATRFPLVEVDSSYYAIPAVSTVRGWIEAAPELTVDVKAFRLLTGHATPVASLPADLRPPSAARWIGSGPGGRDRVTRELIEACWMRFHEVLEPLHAAGRLGVVLLQFPASVVADDAGFERVARALERCRPLRAAVEWRHASWLSGERRERSLRLLAEHGAAYVCVDMPQHSPDAMPPLIRTTTPEVALIRLHGRSDQWADGDKRTRYSYRYSDEELGFWVQGALSLARHSASVHLVVNTCCAGTAQHTAQRLTELLADHERERAVPRARTCPDGASSQPSAPLKP